MGKKLSEMSLEELWDLFPIYLSEHQECWRQWYREEEALLLAYLPEKQIKRISHIGSTAIEIIWAKPIIDILVEISLECEMNDIKEILLECGYLCMSEGKDRMSFNKGYTEHGFAERVYHLHVRYAGDNDELYFRDYLNENPEVAKEYEQLKLSLWKEYEHDRDGYTNSKAGFVSAATRRAKEEYRDKY
ncbi:MAG: GrpB family protein [Lachnospiraceae bacterium]|nr:GrpB family protein [Lachnospiraceae bacterium]